MQKALAVDKKGERGLNAIEQDAPLGNGATDDDEL